MADTRQYILQTLAYFDIFQYPLRVEEIRLFHGQKCSPAAIDHALGSLLADEIIFAIGEFYSLHDDPALAARRRLGNRLAIEHMKTANRAARILSRFPYVRGLAISGSLSKNYSTEKTDIDFFIITAPNRLWIARTLMHLYKKFTFITGRQNWFCMNYYIDEAMPEIEEKNIYTAIEIATLLPMRGSNSIQNFLIANTWIKNYLPIHQKSGCDIPAMQQGLISQGIERIFNNRLGEGIDNLFMRITDRRWQKKVKQQQKNDKGFNIGMKVNKHFSKPNPAFFQDKILDMYADKINQLPQYQASGI